MSCESSSGLPQIGRCCDSQCPEHTGIIAIGTPEEYCGGDVPWAPGLNTDSVGSYVFNGGGILCSTEKQVFSGQNPTKFPSRLKFGAYEFLTASHGGAIQYVDSGLPLTGFIDVSIFKVDISFSRLTFVSQILDFTEIQLWPNISGIFTIPCSSDYLGIILRYSWQSYPFGNPTHYTRLNIRRIADSVAP